MLVGTDATASDCTTCTVGQQYALEGSVSSSQTSGVWTSTFEVIAQVSTASSLQLSIYVKTQARSGDTLLVDSIDRLSSFGGTLIDDSLGYSATAPYRGQSATLALSTLFPQLSPTQCGLAPSPPLPPPPSPPPPVPPHLDGRAAAAGPPRRRRRQWRQRGR